MDIDALEAAARRGEIQACILTPTHQNPLGFCMSDSDKQAAVETLARYEIPLIEDDVFGALGLEYPRPRPAKAYDTAGNVIYCGSFSKVLSPAFRLGWLAPGRYAEEVLWQKILLNISSPTILQLAMVDYLKGNRFRRVTQLAARHYAQRIQTLRDAVLEHFPAGTTCSAPVGGYYLWVEMPGDYDSATLYRHALSNGITLTPGRLFTSAGGYRSCLRMSVAAVTAKVIPEAVAKLGRLAVFCRR
ncbi:MAG: PLP-dependent aminotransferase family protein [Alphaproteobacteria bacterium]